LLKNVNAAGRSLSIAASALAAWCCPTPSSPPTVGRGKSTGAILARISNGSPRDKPSFISNGRINAGRARIDHEEAGAPKI
jgi:hypothetical protein